ncbi:MAG TPA: hypothetical protein VLX68_10765 [Chitinivibrionales bacterium]|nr:hypothetical protein [Chitinivibrionales bacterium]
MMKRTALVLFISVVFCWISSCSSPPQLLWPQKDMDSSSVNDPALAKKVLIASRKSDFKQALVEKIKGALAYDSVYVKCIGLTLLKNEDASKYGAIVIINTCMGWDWDRNIRKFFKGKQDAANVIVLTTSASGKWLPKKKPSGVDAIACASEKPVADKVSADLIGRVKSLLAKR